MLNGCNFRAQRRQCGQLPVTQLCRHSAGQRVRIHRPGANKYQIETSDWRQCIHDPHKLDSSRSCPSDVGIVPENVLIDKSLIKMEYDIVSRSVCLHHIEKQPHSMFNAIIAPKVDGNVPSRRLKYKELEIIIHGW
jgi:hypothetical protein